MPNGINGQRIPTKNTMKVLGITIDRGLTIQHHFDLVMPSWRTRLNLIRTISRPHRSNNRNIDHMALSLRALQGID